MLARLQQFTLLTQCLLTLAWGWWWWGTSVLLALAGMTLLTLGYTLLLALQFAWLRAVNRADPVGSPPWALLRRAWWRECGNAALVFQWRQPFRANAEPDHVVSNGLRGVVLIHGFVCNRGIWQPWLRALRAQNRCVVAVNLEPVFGSIDAYVPIIERAVRQVSQASGRRPVLIGHSMGGLAARAWLCATQGDARIHRVFTLGTPHHGTALGAFASSRNGQQMRIASPWLKALQAQEPAARAGQFVCWYSSTDNIVMPAGTATLAGADNRLRPGLGHVTLACDDTLMQEVLAELEH